MAETSLSLDGLVRKLMGDDHADVLRETLSWFVRELMEAEVSSQIGAELLFDVISSAYERTSLIVTTNLPFESWTEVLGSERLTGATLDRLTHRCQIIETKGESYRLRDAKAKLRKGSAGDSDSGGPRRRALEGGQTSS